MQQKPGIRGGLALSFMTSQEQTIARSIGKVWFITFARPALFKNSQYSVLFAKPTDRLVSDFHFGREVLVLFTPYESFEPRSLDFVDKTIFEYQNRLDKLCVILISRDPIVSDKVRDMAIQDRESRVVVPFAYNEFGNPASPPDVLMVARLKQFFYERDLFAFDSPLRTDAYFFGRHEIIQRLYGKYKSGENGCLFGLRRIGKTSVLLAVKRYLDIREEPGVFLDCSETSFHLRRWNEALAFTVESFRRGLSIPKDAHLHLHAAEDYTEKNASTCFEEDLTKIWRYFGKKRLLLILDEIENITFDISPSDHWTREKDYLLFWQSIRSIYQKNADLFSFLIAGVNPRAVETPTVQGFDNPIYRLVTPTYLGFFDVQEVKEMITSIGKYMGLHFDEEVHTYLVDDYGGHPFLVRQVCSRLHRETTQPRPYTISKFRYQGLRDELTRSIQDYIGSIVNVLKEKYEIEYELLEYLAQGDQATFAEFARMSDTLVQHLMGYGLLRHEGNEYHFRIKAVEDYVRSRSKITKAITSREEKWNQISLQRNNFEADLRKVVKQALKLQYGHVKAREVFLQILPAVDRKQRLALLKLDDMFDAEVYLDDFRKLMKKHWADLGMIFNNDLDHFNTYMEYVNRYRIDAHARDMSEDEFALLRIALQWLQERVTAFLC